MNSDHPSAAGLGAGPIGLYVHHHGRGHLSRALALIANLRSPATVLTSLSVERSELLGADLLRLPLDVPGSVAGDLPAPPGPPLRGLHYAPLGSAGLLERTAAICAWTREVRPSLLVVDVSSEVAALGRLLGLPVVVVRQHGLRDDPAHALACGVAVSLLAPFPKSLEDERTPEWVADRTFYSGGFSRFDGRAEALAPEPVPGRVAVLLGGGGTGVSLAALAAAARSTPGWSWNVLGYPRGGADGRLPPNLRLAGWSGDDVFDELRRSEVVVAGAGHNAVMEVAAARRPLVAIPEDRPFDEQRAKARLLGRSGLAVVRERWPAPERWPGVLREALSLGARGLAGLVDGRGAARAAAHLDGLARLYAGAGPESEESSVHRPTGKGSVAELGARSSRFSAAGTGP
ncbi:Glycosyl transferase family 1 [Rubrobacter radiotolerans]|uniref:Glycosyl transferase family 1 n=1 Tax=Rubrobacter radiotolerans TaxID=42256 RepID=A0A023X2I9_RUBRA|nr:hypothetical protein [Rubrobacter radiotolerans]AHY46210.1 Glycosyl transferase family 1 [Rubrobacter radiotolerans]MDX5893619.1 hypothetical protein [Rubrobacter radiotolerans]SMC04135.1 Predicted glycosyl transferase [Rubrobacter radiotolerans DSM 5868]